jgi:hypothetical protein
LVLRPAFHSKRPAVRERALGPPNVDGANTYFGARRA